MKRFEEGPIDEATGKITRRKLKRDQVLFLAKFAEVCDTVWTEERRVEQNDKNFKRSQCKCFQFLLMGEGGTGKTAIIQEIVLPTTDYVFEVRSPERRPALVVCAKWSQCENISTSKHAAISCHRAGAVGLQAFTSNMMPVGRAQQTLYQMWQERRLLIMEEVSMIGANLYNMLMWRSFQARRDEWQVDQSRWRERSCLFGRMPIVIHLGDFLQLKPVGPGNMSLVTSMRQVEEDSPDGKGPHVEYQEAMRVFCQTPLVFELTESNRFKDPRLAKLISFMRKPAKTLPEDVIESWNAICAVENDPRWLQEEFVNGHIMAIYWESCVRFINYRAIRDARMCNTPLYWIQAADRTSAPLDPDTAAKLLTIPNPAKTGSTTPIRDVAIVIGSHSNSSQRRECVCVLSQLHDVIHGMVGAV